MMIEKEKTLESALETCKEILREAGFSAAVIVGSIHDAENSLTYARRAGIGDWYAQRGLVAWQAQDMKENDAKAIPVFQIDTGGTP